MVPSHLHMTLALCSPAVLGWKWTGIVEKHLFLTSTTECTVLKGELEGKGKISTILSLPLLFSILTLAMDTSPTLIEGKTTTSFSRVTVPLFCFFPPTIGLVLDAGGWTSDLPFIRDVNRIFKESIYGVWLIITYTYAMQAKKSGSIIALMKEKGNHLNDYHQS